MRDTEIKNGNDDRKNENTEDVIGYAIKVHRSVGPGLLESAYEACMDYELRNTILEIERQKPLRLIYEEVKLDCGYRLDFMANRKVIIEIKSIEDLNDIHLARILIYLRLSGCKVGLLINFNVLKLTNGLKRVVNNY